MHNTEIKHGFLLKGFEVGYNNDDFCHNQKTYYKTFDCGSKYGNCKCQLFYKMGVLTIVLKNKLKASQTFNIRFIILGINFELLMHELYNYLLQYENNTLKATS